jgi:LacI family transcriptional regulator
LEVTPELVTQGFFTYRSGLQAGAWLLDNSKPTAIFAANDEMAAAAMAVAHRRNMDVPRDVTVVGFDDTPLATMISPHLTTIRRPVAAMAARSVELLLDCIRTDRGSARKRFRREILPYTLLIRRSSGPPPTVG